MFRLTGFGSRAAFADHSRFGNDYENVHAFTALTTTVNPYVCDISVCLI